LMAVTSYRLLGTGDGRRGLINIVSMLQLLVARER
jgi:hypothetical protein